MSITSTGLGKRFLRRRAVAQRYGITPRSVDRWSADGRLPVPIYRGKIPLWDEAGLDESDRAAAEAHRSRKRVTTEFRFDGEPHDN